VQRFGFSDEKALVFFFACVVLAVALFLALTSKESVDSPKTVLVQRVSEQLAAAEPGDIVVLKDGLILGVEGVGHGGISLRTSLGGVSTLESKQISVMADEVHKVVSQRDCPQHREWGYRFFYQHMGLPRPLFPSTLPAEAP
jgi:hypothetical protein